MRFLIIDDNPADRELVVLKLRKEFPNTEFVQVGRLEDLDRAISYDHFDIVLTDYQLNWTNGLQILNRVKLLFPDVPVLMVTGTGSEEIAVEGLRAGLSNYILKDHLERLPVAIRESIEKAHLHRQYEDAIEQLRLSEERYREIFEQGLTAVFVATPEGILLTCNSAFAHIFGFTSVDEAMAMNLSALYPQIEQFRSFINLLSREKRLEYHEMHMQRRDGIALYVVENILGSFDDAGRLVEIKGYIFDNTERRKLSDQLQQAQRLESVGLLVSGIAHDFNNMLGGILGYTSRSLARIANGNPLYDNLVHIQEIANRAARMTHQLLAFSRRQVLEPTDISLNTVVENLLSFLGKILADHIEIEFVADPDLKMVHVDPGQMEQVLMNLCVNAHDAMPDGGKLTIRTHNVPAEVKLPDQQQLQGVSYVLLMVQDTGMGMDEKIRAQIFEPFFTTKEVGKGTGLGLSMVHGIIGQQNGYIHVESAPDEGTTFSIYLPTVEVLSQSSGDLLPTSSDLLVNEISPEILMGGEETILVVEDDPDLRFLMQEALLEYGYKVVSAVDGLEGLQLFEEHNRDISLVVSDLMTPRMKGKELYDEIHARCKETKFLFVSGYQTNQISQNFVLDKEFSFLQKPFDLDDLALKVRDILD